MVTIKYLAAFAALAPVVLTHPMADAATIVPRLNSATIFARKGTSGACKTRPSPSFLADVAAFSNLEKTHDNSTKFNIMTADEVKNKILNKGSVSVLSTAIDAVGNIVSREIEERSTETEEEEPSRIEARASAVTINTYFHNVYKDATLDGGYIPKARLASQINVMNQIYAKYGFQFKLVNYYYIKNANWAVDENGGEYQMKQALRKGDYRSLNIYFIYDISGNLGYCYYPQSGASPGSEVFIYDGCTILYNTVPGGSYVDYNQGKTAVHEVGHWFGLLHTFEGESCSGSGDQISDTPQQSSPTSGCPASRNSCPNQAGNDPINNYMDYSSDSCYTQFSAGQNQRMVNMYNTYRR